MELSSHAKEGGREVDLSFSYTNNEMYGGGSSSDRGRGTTRGGGQEKKKTELTVSTNRGRELDLSELEALDRTQGLEGDSEDEGDDAMILEEGERKKPSMAQEEPRTLKQSVAAFMDGPAVTLVMTLMTIYALFGDDIKYLLCPKSADETFLILSSIAFFSFGTEFLLSCVVKDGYLKLPDWSDPSFQKKFQLGSFYFWLDLIATASLIFEITWIYAGEDNDVNSSGQSNGLQSARAGRASRAGARAGRIIRFVRMVRLVRLVKLYKYLTPQNAPSHHQHQHHTSGHEAVSSTDSTQTALSTSTSSTHPSRSGGSQRQKGTPLSPRAMSKEEEQLQDLSNESRLGSAMSDLTTRRVILLVLAMLIIIPFLTFTTSDSSMQFGLEVVHNFMVQNLSTNGTSFVQAATRSIDVLRDQTKLVYLDLDGSTLFDKASRMSDLRDIELLSITIETGDLTSLSDGSFQTKGVFDVKTTSSDASLLSILMTVFVIILLVIGTFFFSSDVNRLVIVPIEKMVRVVEKISKNPLEQQAFDIDSDDFEQGMETTLLLQTINKVAGLMRIGFGMAGADMIAQNLQTSSNNQLDLLTSGNMIQSIFGFCDIRNFTDTTECLQEEVMLFVNKIAHILHGVMSQYNGAANKNIGDAFLLTWKLKEGSTVEDLSALADQALLCFIRTMIELKKRNDFVCNFSPGAYQRLYKRMPGYTVKMGFGLHLGWAVEGALGSFRKIDATYISPHVNMSEFLESSTKTYGIPLLMSEAFWNCLSPVPKQDARLCDRVQPGPHDAPLSLYTYDVDLKLVGQGGKFGMGRSSHQRGGSGPGPAPGRGGHILRNFSRKMVFEERKGGEDVGKERVPEIQVPAYYQEIWERDSELKAIRAPFSRSYIAAWHEAMELYLSGDWSSCHEALLDLQNSPMAAKIEDGPLMWLLDLLERHQLEAPAGWEGYRDVS